METVPSAPLETKLTPPKSRELKFGATQHFPDFREMDRQEMGKVCERIIEAGADTVRWDFRWKNVIGEDKQLNKDGFDRYVEAMKIMKEKGLSQVMVISDVPKYVKNLARKGDFEGFKCELNRYLAFMEDACKQAGINEAGPDHNVIGPQTIQVFNELNFGPYNDWINIGPMNSDSKFGLLQLKDTLETVRQYFPASDRSINIQISNLVSGVEKVTPITGKLASQAQGVAAERYLSEILRTCGDSFEEVGLDYYPGLYNLDRLTLKAMWTNMNPLLQILDQAADTRTPLGNKVISISEFGALSDLKIPKIGRLFTEKTQRGFYIYFIREVYRTMRIYDSRAKADPTNFRQPISSITCYQVQDEFDEAIPEPMRHFGVFTKEGGKKGYVTEKGKRRDTVDTLRRIFDLKHQSGL